MITKNFYHKKVLKMLNKVANSIFKIFIEIFIFDKTKRSKIKAKYAKYCIRKYVDSAAKNLKILPQNAAPQKRIIWQYWHQGKENAPELIQKCFESVKQQMPEYEQIILSFDTIKDYVDLPQRYYDLVKQGNMSIAHFSDILRTYLLSDPRWGGTWIDSTIYLTGKIPDDIMNSKFCVLQKNPQTDNQENKMSCFFIHSRPESANINALKNFLDKYWAENDFVINYFFYEHASTMLSDLTPELKQEWDSMPYYDAEITGLMQKQLLDKYSIEGWKALCEKTNIHKLSYKVICEKTSGKTYYDYILKN